MKTTLIQSFVFCFLFATFSLTISAKDYKYFVGTYTRNTASEGIYMVSVNPENQQSTIKYIQKDIVNPSFLSFNAQRNLLYAITETTEASYVHAYHFDPETHTTSFAGKVLLKGKGPCHITHSDNHLFIANYGNGSLDVVSLDKQGIPVEYVQYIKHTGSSINVKRQTSPHTHQVVLSKDKRFLLTNDLGTDYTYCYQYNPEENTCLQIFDSIKHEPGSGPRHLTFSKNGKTIYLIQELTGQVSVIAFSKGKFNLLQQSTVITKQDGDASGADIHIAPNGKYLYVSNRANYNNISAFRILPDNKIKFISQHETTGKAPRNFSVTKDGKYLLAGNQNSHFITVFKILKDGKLLNTGMKVEIPAPVCLIEF